MNRITVTLLCLMLCLAGTSIPTASAAINFEQSTATLMTHLSQTTATSDVANAVALIKTTSLGSHASAFAAEQTTVATPLTTPTTPSAIPAQVVALETPVVPPPSIRPFPAPVTTRTVTVPDTIDATGTTEVSAALNTFIESVPDGSIISFPTGATYLLNEGIQISKRHNLVFAGDGTTLRVSAAAAGNNALASPFAIGFLFPDHDWYGGCTDIVIHDFILVGNDATPGTFTEGWEYEANLQIFDADRVEIYGITGSAAPGDFIHCEQVNGAWIHDNHAISTGRNGISVISGSGILAEDCAFDASGFITFDVEPNGVNDASSDVTFRNCTAGTYGNYFSAVVPANTGAIIDGVVFDGNTVTGGSLKTLVGNGTTRIKHITFTNNKGGRAAAGSVLQFSHVDSLTVTGNVQPLSSGALKSIADCTGAP
jgi:hypothetical protein